MVELPTLVLVHSPLVGPSTWESAAECFRRKGYPVAVSSLDGVVDDGAPYYRGFAEAAARAVVANEGDRPAVLVGHSGAGALLPSIADAVGDSVHGAVFVDAILPHPGGSWFDTAPPQLRDHLAGLAHAGWLPPWNEWFPAEAFDTLLPDEDMRERFVAELPRLPVTYFEESAPVTHGWPAVRCAYVRLSEAYDRSADEAVRRGWWVHRENADHLAMLTQPDRVTDAVVQAVVAVADM
ncbi:hypothetical protein SD37_11885 [Amycolatopsis orientalis]|uniref:AB hydrolase-1 domain-containing protein n=2 Tax=Amycolatopsis orientalis TaxID=31958 RepID=A0A193CBN0_AMYOR|nr:hypothetical protein SD37_11885 [Amycolatopsis orientalis]